MRCSPIHVEFISGASQQQCSNGDMTLLDVEKRWWLLKYKGGGDQVNLWLLSFDECRFAPPALKLLSTPQTTTKSRRATTSSSSSPLSCIIHKSSFLVDKGSTFGHIWEGGTTTLQDLIEGLLLLFRVVDVVAVLFLARGANWMWSQAEAEGEITYYVRFRLWH